MKTKYIYALPKICCMVLVCLTYFFAGCSEQWESSLSEIAANKVTLKVQTVDSQTGEVLPNVKVAVYSKPRGQAEGRKVFEGGSDDNGELNVQDFDVPNQAEIVVVDTRFPPAPPQSVKVLSEATATISLEVSKTWNETHIYDATGWEALAVSSVNGSSHGQNVLIENTATWHTRYSPAPAEDFPHWIIIDMKSAYALHGLAFKQRANNNGPIRAIEFYVSNDNQSWTPALTTEVPYTNPGSWHVLPFTQEYEARYLKFVVTAGYLQDVTFINLERLGVF